MTDNAAVLFALTSHDRLGDTGRPTGFMVAEAAHPWRVFTDNGYRVDLVSPQGGAAPRTSTDLSDPDQRAFLEDPGMKAKLAATPRPQEVDPTAYDAIFYVGGHGTMWDFPDDAGLAAIARDIYEAGGVVAAVCHGPAGLLNIKLSDGSRLIDGREVAAFTNSEEEAVNLSDVMPFALQTELERRGAKHSAAENFAAHTVVDGRLVTGQNPASATGTAAAAVRALQGRGAGAR